MVKKSLLPTLRDLKSVSFCANPEPRKPNRKPGKHGWQGTYSDIGRRLSIGNPGILEIQSANPTGTTYVAHIIYCGVTSL